MYEQYTQEKPSSAMHVVIELTLASKTSSMPQQHHWPKVHEPTLQKTNLHSNKWFIYYHIIILDHMKKNVKDLQSWSIVW